MCERLTRAVLDHPPGLAAASGGTSIACTHAVVDRGWNPSSALALDELGG